MPKTETKVDYSKERAIVQGAFPCRVHIFSEGTTRWPRLFELQNPELQSHQVEVIPFASVSKPKPRIVEESGPSPSSKIFKLEIGVDESWSVSGRDFRDTAPKLFGGILDEVNTLNNLPIKPILRNAELFRFLVHNVVPNMVSVNGYGIPPLFLKEMFPWMLQLPSFPNIAILMSATQALEQGVDMKASSEVIAAKSNVFALVNTFFEQDFVTIGGEALRAFIHLVVTEWFWGDDKNIWPHMRSVKEMVRLRGGLHAMNDPLIASVLTL